MPTLTVDQRVIITHIENNNFSAVQFHIERESIDFIVNPESNTDLITHAIQIQIGLRYTNPADHLAMVKLLLAHNPPLDRFNKEGYTPLSQAAYRGYLEITETLLDAGATVDFMGITDVPYLPLVSASAFHRAALTGNIEMLRLLHSRGADINAVKVQIKRERSVTRDSFFALFEEARNHNHTLRETALDITIRQGHTEASEFLRGLGATTFQSRETAQATRQCCVVL